MEAEVILLACPSGAVRDLCARIRPHLSDAWQLKLALVMCKGIDLESFETPSEMLARVLPDLPCGVLSGPTYASEVAAGQPTAVVLGLPECLEHPERYQAALSNASLRCYLSDDVRGTELGGTLKNIYAIGSGLCDGLKLGDNAKAAFLTRSLTEMVLLGDALGAAPETFYGLSGFGDLIATCNGAWSRNRTFGQRVGEGEQPQTVIESQRTVVEGYRATECLKRYCSAHGIEAPILREIHAVLYEGRSPREGIHALMTRDLRSE